MKLIMESWRGFLSEPGSNHSDSKNLISEWAIDAIAKDTVDAINSELPDGSPVATIGRAKVGHKAGTLRYATKQNMDVLIAGPYMHDFMGQINDDATPGHYYFSIYSKRNDSPFYLYQEYAEKYLDDLKLKAKKEKIRSSEGKETLRKVWKDMTNHVEGSEGYNKYMETEAYWNNAAANAAKKGVGTHKSGGAFDLGGYHDRSDPKHLEQIYSIVDRVAKNHGTEMMPVKTGGTDAESDHIHVSLKMA